MKISIVGNNFSNYDQTIAKSLRTSGDDVSVISYKGFIPDRLKYDFKTLSVLFYFFISLLSIPSRFLITISTALETNKKDLVICINGSFLMPFVFRFIGTPKNLAIWIMDSASKYPRIIDCKKIKCQIFSYSEQDCRKYKFRFLPLFSALVSDTQKASHKSFDAIRYDIAFIGAIDLYRLNILEDISRRAKANSLNIYLGGVFGKITTSGYLFKSSPTYSSIRSVFHNRRHTFDEIKSIYSSSKVIFNYNVGDQPGSSMRFFEAICSGAPQIIDPIVAQSIYSRLILKIRPTDFFSGYPTYMSMLDLDEIKKSTSLESRISRIKKIMFSAATQDDSISII